MEIAKEIILTAVELYDRWGEAEFTVEEFARVAAENGMILEQIIIAIMGNHMVQKCEYPMLRLKPEWIELIKRVKERIRKTKKICGVCGSELEEKDGVLYCPECCTVRRDAFSERSTRNRWERITRRYIFAPLEILNYFLTILFKKVITWLK